METKRITTSGQTLRIIIGGELLNQLKKKCLKEGFPILYYARFILARQLGVKINDRSVQKGVYY